MKWVVSFSSAKVHIDVLLSFIPEFVVQAMMGFHSGQKNTAFDSIRRSLLTPPLSFRTGVILIETRGRSRTFPSIFHISLKSQVRPWGLSLACCSGCGFDHYLNCDPISGSIICLNCDSTGVVERPQTWQVDVASQVKQEFWVGTLRFPIGDPCLFSGRAFELHIIPVTEIQKLVKQFKLFVSSS